MQKKFSKNSLKQISKAGLPAPDPGLTNKEYAKLQKQWYAKLEADGFKDLEWVDHKTGKGHNSDFLRGSFGGGKRYHAGRDLHYRLASNYLMHCKNLRGYNRFIWKLHSEGETYEDIVKQIRKKYKKKVSVYKVYYDLKQLTERCYKWNARYNEGLLIKWEEDKRAQEQLDVDAFLKPDYDWLLGPAPAEED